MTAKFFSNDELSALAYEANQMASAGYEAEAQLIRRQPTFTAWIAETASRLIKSLSATLFSHDLPAALAYEANQIAATGYKEETQVIESQPAFINWIAATTPGIIKNLGPFLPRSAGYTGL